MILKGSILASLIKLKMNRLQSLNNQFSAQETVNFGHHELKHVA